VTDERVQNEWGFWSFPTEDAARAYVRRFTTQKGGPWYIWRLPDGTFDFTSTKQPRESMTGNAELAGMQAGAYS
jgi:hypothetical protein